MWVKYIECTYVEEKCTYMMAGYRADIIHECLSFYMPAMIQA